MKRLVDCGIVQDLLPLYIEKLASESSVRAIEEHIAECGECRDMLKELREPITSVPETEKKEVDFLKKLRKRSKKIVGAVIGLAAILLLLGAAFLVKIFVIGMPVSPDNIMYECSYNEETRELTVHGTINLSMTSYSGVTVKEDPSYVGVLNLEVRGAERIFRDKKYNTYFTETVVIPEDGNDWQVHLVGPSYQRLLMWESTPLWDMTQEELDEYFDTWTRVSSEQVRNITADMTSEEVQDLLGSTASVQESGSMEYALKYIVDEEYEIWITFSADKGDQSCGLTGEEILEGKVPKQESWGMEIQ